MTRSRLALLGAALAVFAAGAATGATLLARDGDEVADHAAAGHAADTTDTTDHGGMHPVAGNFAPDETALEDCEQGDARCLEQAYGNIAFKEGPEAALAAFDTAIARDPDVEAGCHRIAHMIGSAALEGLEGNVAQAFARGSASCWSGYYHGILERAFADVSSREEVADVARDLCEDEEIERTTFLLYQCVHGLGHGLMIYSGYDLPFSLSICDRLEADWDQTSCTGGVFMENISTSYGIKSKWVRDEDPVFPCQTVAERHKLYCYLMVTSRINELNGFDWKDTAETCKRVEKGWIETCFESYGRDASGNSRQDAPTIQRLCRLAGRYEGSCVYGAARDMTSNYAGGKEASELCRLVRRPLRAKCYNGIGTILGNLGATDEEKRRSCTEVTPPAYRAACLSGTGVLVAAG